MGSYPCWRDGKPATDLVLRGTDKALLDEATSGLRVALKLE
jgi:hypothetical protein